MLSKSLEETLRRAMTNASSLKHEFATLEHLLFALLKDQDAVEVLKACLLYTSPSPRDAQLSRMPSSA